MWITTKILILQYFIFTTIFTFKWGFNEEMISRNGIIINAISLLMIYFYSEAISKLIKNNKLRIIISLLLITIDMLAAKYKYRVRSSFDFALLIDNIDEAFNNETLGVIQNTLKYKDFKQALLFIPVLLFIQYKYKSFTKKVNYSVRKSFGYIATFIFLIIVSPMPYGEINFFFSSIYNYYFSTYPKTLNYSNIEPSKFFYKQVNSKFKKNRPDIIVINIESFNSTFVNMKNENDEEVTPKFNELIKSGVYIEDFYGNSIQTIKGQYALLCSKIPFIRGKASYDLKNFNRLKCLPNLMKEFGYETYFHDGFPDLKFDRTDHFMKSIGFENIKGTSTSGMSEEDIKRYVWGWGPQDSISYSQFLKNFLELKKDGKPIFSMIHTISNHMKFNKVPNQESNLYKKGPGKDKRKMYMNSINVSDKYMGEFIELLVKENLLENTIIIITGDHSYPAGEHGLYDNQVSYYQEFFKTPMLIIYKNVLAPKIISKKTNSHIDVLPTIVDMIGESGIFETMGQSIFSDEESVAYLVQPYNGVYLGAVKYPWKYVWERRTNSEILYNIENDPNETIKIDNLNVKNDFRKYIDNIVYNFEYFYKK